MILYWLLCHLYVFSPHLSSEKPPPCGCRHCWLNHVKYCVYCRVFSPSSLCLIGLSHSIGLLSCPISLLKRFRTYPFATRVFLTLQLAPSVGTDTASLGLSGGYHRVDRLPIYRTPERSPPLELARASQSSGKEAPRATTRSRPNGLRNLLLRASNRAVDTTIEILITRSEERREERPHRSRHAPVEAPATSPTPSTCQRMPSTRQRTLGTR